MDVPVFPSFFLLPWLSAKVILIEPSGITSSGNSDQEYAEDNDVWI